jgi:ADP-ribosylglycohydrolase
MRCIPTALVTTDPLQRADEVTAISAITHDDLRCVLACVAYTEMVVALVGGRNPQEAVAEGRVAMQDGAIRRRVTTRALEFTAEASAAGLAVQSAAAAVTEALELGLAIDLGKAVTTGEAGLPHGGTGYVLDSLSLAVAALADPRPAVDSLVDVTRLGGDTDTNGAIAGGLLGARDGAGAWPVDWVERLQFAAEFKSAASVFAHWS